MCAFSVLLFFYPLDRVESGKGGGGRVGRLRKFDWLMTAVAAAVAVIGLVWMLYVAIRYGDAVRVSRGRGCCLRKELEVGHARRG